jgi:hypothetical protein
VRSTGRQWPACHCSPGTPAFGRGLVRAATLVVDGTSRSSPLLAILIVPLLAILLAINGTGVATTGHVWPGKPQADAMSGAIESQPAPD